MVYEQEKQRATHLLILFVCTIMIFVLTAESFLLGWDKGAIVLLWIGLVASWVIHITETIPAGIRLWLYFILCMLAFFFYGIHETSVYDLAPVMILAIIMFSSADMYSLIRLCVLTYFLTMGYDFLFVMGSSMEISPLVISRILLHLLLVYMSGYMTKLGINRRSKERKQMEEQIGKLEETNQKTEDFLTNVSHELRTPINAVTGISAVMLKNEEDEGKQKDLISIQAAGYRLFSQIGDILDYTEIDTGKMKLSEDTYMISSLINDLIASNRIKLKEGLPELIFDVDADVPAVMLGDEKKIKKILGHLIDNAYKFTQKGGIYVRIYALRKEYGINLCIRVSDTGVGISEDELEMIQERFYQSNTGRDRKAGGLGLGLPIVYGMVSAMEGFIQIKSRLGEGTTVSVSIPQKVVDEGPCMVVEKREELCLACYLKLELYEVPEIRDYYNASISHMVQGLEVTLHRVFHMDELEKLVSMYQLTHLFIGRAEYEENRYYFEELDPGIQVIVVAEDHYVLPERCRVKLLKKPFYSLPLVNILNAETEEETQLKEKSMICPGVRVLVVDDEPMNLMVAEGIFKEYQMRVTTAESGRKAIDLCEKEDFDLIFLDHMMPEMDGVETLKRLRKAYADTGRVPTVIAFTANAVSGAREMFLREGFDEFVSKPIEPLEMERILRKVLPKSSFLYVDEEERKAAKEATDNPTVEDKLSRLEQEDIHTDAGIQYCGGDKDFYVELLTKFAKDSKRKGADISQYFQQQDWQNYTILVHALKSTAKMVGADALSEQAKDMEAAAKNQDADFIRKNQDALLFAYHQVVQCIVDVLDLELEGSGQNGTGEKNEISKAELLLRLAELKKGLDTFEADKAEDLLAKLSEAVYGGTSVYELLYDTRQDVDDFEFASASEKVASLIQKVEGGEVG